MKRLSRPERGGVWKTYFEDNRTHMQAAANALLSGMEPEPQPEVMLLDFDPEGEVKVVAAALYAVSQLPDHQLMHRVRQMSFAERLSVLSAYVGRRENRRHKPGRAFERTKYRFDILTDYGAFRDLQRHRLLTLEWQPLSCRLGYSTPESVYEAGALDKWKAVMNSTADLYERMHASIGPDVAQYCVPMAYKIRFYMDLNAREAMHVIELRTAPQGHPSYRRVCQMMHKLISDEAGHTAIAEAMKFVNYESVDLERLESEKASARRRNDFPSLTRTLKLEPEFEGLIHPRSMVFQSIDVQRSFAV